MTYVFFKMILVIGVVSSDRWAHPSRSTGRYGRQFSFHRFAHLSQRLWFAYCFNCWYACFSFGTYILLDPLWSCTLLNRLFSMRMGINIKNLRKSEYVSNCKRYLTSCGPIFVPSETETTHITGLI